jgi:hypothetical protein
MEKQNFEKKLEAMTKPEIQGLKHESMLADAIINAKDKSAVSWWWLSVPVFIILMLMMKSTFMPGTTLLSNMHELEGSQKYMSLIFFLISPLVLIIINAFSIRKIYFLSGSPKSINFLGTIWFNILIIGFSVLILIIYSL